MFCHNCGKGIPANIKFCPHCGTQVIPSPPAEHKSEPASTDPPQQLSKPFSHSKPGLGVKAEEVTSIFSRLGFKIENAPLSDKTPRIRASKEKTGTIMELIGEPSNLKKITIFQQILPEIKESIEMSVYIIFIVRVCTKDEELSGKIISWLAEQVKSRTESEVSNIFKNLKIFFKFYTFPYPSFSITFEPVSY